MEIITIFAVLILVFSFIGGCSQGTREKFLFAGSCYCCDTGGR